MANYIILDERAWMDPDGAIELEACSDGDLRKSCREWPNAVVFEIKPDGRRTLVGGTDEVAKDDE